MTGQAYGWEEPPDYDHVLAWPWDDLGNGTPSVCETAFTLPKWHWTHNQWETSSCVGHAIAFERALVNSRQAAMLRPGPSQRRYDPLHAWVEGKALTGRNPQTWDEWLDGGVPIRDAYEAVRLNGIPLIANIKRGARLKEEAQASGSGGGSVSDVLVVPQPVARRANNQLVGSIQRYRWMTTVDEVRAAVATGHAVVIGGRWDPAWDQPLVSSSGEWRLTDVETPLGSGYVGHVFCIFGGSDAREAFLFKNSWGEEYPICWIPYVCVARMLANGGEAVVVTDR